jgi:hypothetical protein
MAVVDGAVHVVASNRALEAARPNAASRAAVVEIVVEMANNSVLTARLVLERASSSHAEAAAAVLLLLVAVAVVVELKVKVTRYWTTNPPPHAAARCGHWSSCQWRPPRLG